ncbi:hypothetical protein ACMYYO_02460 [Dermacoccaceae bacterium W4C1]
MQTPLGFALGVVATCGGAGASTFAAAVAGRAAVAGHLSVLIDLDAGGGGADVRVGCDHLPGLRWADLSAARAGLDGPALLERLPHSAHQVAVLSADADGSVGAEPGAGAVCRALRNAADVCVIDLGRSIPPWIDELDAVAVVVRADVTGLSAARGRCAAALQAGAPAWLVGRDLPSDLMPAVSEALAIPHLCTLREDRFCAPDLRAGRAPGIRDRSGSAVAAEAALRRLLTQHSVP